MPRFLSATALWAEQGGPGRHRLARGQAPCERGGRGANPYLRVKAHTSSGLDGCRSSSREWPDKQDPAGRPRADRSDWWLNAQALSSGTATPQSRQGARACVWQGEVVQMCGYSFLALGHRPTGTVVEKLKLLYCQKWGNKKGSLMLPAQGADRIRDKGRRCVGFEWHT